MLGKAGCLCLVVCCDTGASLFMKRILFAMIQRHEFSIEHTNVRENMAVACISSAGRRGSCDFISAQSLASNRKYHEVKFGTALHLSATFKSSSLTPQEKRWLSVQLQQASLISKITYGVE